MREYRVDIAVMVASGALPRYLIIFPFTFIDVAVAPLEASRDGLAVLHEVADVAVPVAVRNHPVAPHAICAPLTCVHVAVRPSYLPEAMSAIILPRTCRKPYR